jgi:hypothetical protein
MKGALPLPRDIPAAARLLGVAGLCWSCGEPCIITVVLDELRLRKCRPEERAVLDAQPDFIAARQARQEHPYSAAVAVEAIKMKLGR